MDRQIVKFLHIGFIVYLTHTPVSCRNSIKPTFSSPPVSPSPSPKACNGMSLVHW
ncbi:MAG: hypothetical protein JW913_00485 [Chitinispirillaceae bacterium]|nr:hypothetical protein [Chitinispirillaceae bacterium]